MKNKNNLCDYSFLVDLKFGPIVIPKKHQASKEIAIEYVLEKYKDYIRDNSVFMFDKKDNKKATLLISYKNKK